MPTRAWRRSSSGASPSTRAGSSVGQPSSDVLRARSAWPRAASTCCSAWSTSVRVASTFVAAGAAVAGAGTVAAAACEGATVAGTATVGAGADVTAGGAEVDGATEPVDEPLEHAAITMAMAATAGRSNFLEINMSVGPHRGGDRLGVLAGLLQIGTGRAELGPVTGQEAVVGVVLRRREGLE